MYQRAFLACLLLILCVGFLPAQQPETRTFRYGTQAIEVATSSELIGVGFLDHERAGPANLLAAHAGLLASIETDLPPHRTAVLRLAPGVTPDQACAVLRADPAVRFAHPVYHLGNPALEASRQILTDAFCIGLAPGADADALAALVGASAVRSFAWPGTWLLQLNPGAALDPIQACDLLLHDRDVLFAHPDWLRLLEERYTPNDPQYTSQWHLKNTGQGGGTPGADVKADQAWDLTRGDAGTIICVIDSGVENTHVDLRLTAQGFNAMCGAGVNMGDPRPQPCSSSYAGNHGTSCAGVAAARINNGIGVAGVAGECTVLPINLLGSGMGYGTPSMEAACFDHATANGAAVITNSWGPDGVPWPLPSLVQTAFINATTNGRGGLGCCIFWAGGNGNELITSDGYASSFYTMAVAASTNYDTRASYSDYGPEVDFAAPSNGGSLGITTTSTNSSGASNYTSSFGGTSSASPLAAGVAGLVVSWNPSLTWIQVRDILRNTADQINPSASPGAGNYYNPTTGHSPWYGHGRINAYQALLAAGPSTAFSLALTTTGVGDLDLQITNAPASAELYIPIAVNSTIPLGSGPVFGLDASAMFTLVYPLGVHPFHVLATPAGTYGFTLPAGIVPALTLDARGLTFNFLLGVIEMTNLVRTSF